MKRYQLARIAFTLTVVLSCCITYAQSLSGQALPGTELLRDLANDPAAEMVAGIDRFALGKIEQAKNLRATQWRDAVDKSRNLSHLKTCLGLPALRIPPTDTGFLYERSILLDTQAVTVDAIRWPVGTNPAPQLQAAASLWGAGVMIRPTTPVQRLAIVLPDADESPEDYLGMTSRVNRETCSQPQQLVRQLVAKGFTVVIPQLVSRALVQHRNARLSQREYLHRAAFELGRTLIGYEVEMVQALIDHFPNQRSLVCGFGEGGRLALFCGGIDERIEAVVCCGYFGPRESMWHEPLSRNVFGLLERFGDAELAALIAPRRLVIGTTPNYHVHLNSAGGAPADWSTPSGDDAQAEFSRLHHFAQAQRIDLGFAVLLPSDSAAPLAQQILDGLGPDFEVQTTVARSDAADRPLCETDATAEDRVAQRGKWLMAIIDAHTQAILHESDYARVHFMNIGLPRDDLADRSNAIATQSIAEYEQSQSRFRQVFREQIIGHFDQPLLPLAPRTRKNYSGPGWTGYDVVLDVFPEVFAYGVLLLPDNLAASERRPVVVCQHGLEGRPQDIIQGDHSAYHDFAAKLAQRGFIVFAPQNPYIGKDHFRTLQRKLNPIGKTLFSVIGAQHEQILRWLSSLPNVDPDRIAFYGLSYGGKSAMRLPALLPQYCLSICSADFNDWVWKNASSRSPYSYIGTGEYEIFEFNLGHTFNYAEMAALIAPRPFMVERGHLDGVAPDDRVAKEFARVRFLYAARLGLPDRCEIEWFHGPHTINGQGTFRFLHKHLHWPEPGQ